MSNGMSRWTPKNIAKAVTAFFFWPFVAYYVLVIGLVAKKKKVISEGASYAIAFTAMVAFSGGFLGGFTAFVGVGAMVASAVRSYQLRDLWLPLPNSSLRQGRIAHPPPYSQLGSRPYQDFSTQQTYTMPPPRVPQPAPLRQPQPAPPPFKASATPPPSAAPPPAEPVKSGLSDDLPGSLEWVSSAAKRNKHRLPSEAYVSILETTQELGFLIDTEKKSPSHDAEFEYELEAMVNQYLPAVLKGYLAIPPTMVEQVQPNGKTPNVELVEQLELLSGQTGALYASRYSDTAAELSTTGNFLRERFGHHKKDAFDFGIE